jgi:hypothetical protein
MLCVANFAAVKEEGCCIKTRLNLKYYPSRPVEITQQATVIQTMVPEGHFRY